MLLNVIVKLYYFIMLIKVVTQNQYSITNRVYYSKHKTLKTLSGASQLTRTLDLLLTILDRHENLYLKLILKKLLG